MPEITLFRVRSAQIGYGRLGVYLADEIAKQGVTVYDEIETPPVSYVLDNPAAYDYFGDAPKPGLTNVVAWCSVPSHARGWWKGQVPVLFTMFETNHLPTSFRENFHEFDTLVVPSEQNLELFSRYHHNVHYVPLGVDTERWTFIPRTMPTTRFNFLIGGRGQRKGTDLAYQAFRKVFPNGSWPSDGPVPYLIMKSPRPEDYYGDRIESVTGYLDAQAERDLYASAHCYLQPSRGEGFGLQPLQAMCQGLPTILTDAHGHASFAKYGMGLSSKMSQAGYFVFGEAGEWWEPDFDELCDSMRWVYDNYAQAVDRAAQAAPHLRKTFTWKRSADMFLDAIGRERLTPYQGPRDWHEPTGRLYKIVLLRDHKADIGGKLMAFSQGEEYRVTADVKRILFDAGLVDIEKSRTGDGIVWDAGDEGLSPEQIEQIPKLLERQSYCPTCHQKYGSGEQHVDKILESS